MDHGVLVIGLDLLLEFGSLLVFGVGVGLGYIVI